MSDDEKITLYQSLFRGRADVYARRWEKGDKSGWSPAYSFDWTEFNAHRAHGGTLKDFENKTLLPVTNDIIEKHLAGKDTLGVYPILEDNTSYFIAADFDGTSWRNDARKLIEECAKYNLSAYTEISRSGNGCHVWIFFEETYPCWKSRKILLELIRTSQNHSELLREASFDRLFPNQDTITDGGFGNLIGLPLQGERAQDNCTVFYNPQTDTIYPDQFAFLSDIHNYSAIELDTIFAKICDTTITKEFSSPSEKLIIHIDNDIYLKRSQVSSTVINFIKQELNIFNKEYGMKKRLGKPVFGIEQYFHLIQEQGESIILPKGFLQKLTAFLEDQSLPYEVQKSERVYGEATFKSQITLRDDQETLVHASLQHSNGVIIAPPGSGKTIVALEMITQLRLPTLILVNRNQLLHQWIERIEQFLGIPKAHIGVISGVKKKIRKEITVATLQSLVRYKNFDDLKDKFGVIVIDECHHIPAKTYREVILSLKSNYCYGLTATHERRHGQHIITEYCIGPVITEMQSEKQTESSQQFDIQIYESSLTLPFRYKNDHYEVLAKTICYDSARNTLICEQVQKQIEQHNKILILTERKEHIEVLALYLRNTTEIITLSGDDSVRQRKLKIDQIHAGNFKVLIATGQLLGEGIDIQGFDTLVLAFPLSFEGKLKQYIGRLRGEGVKHVIDIHDSKVDFLDRQFMKRKKVYEKYFNLY